MRAVITSITQSRLWRSIFRFGWPDTVADRTRVITQVFFLHVHPARVRLASLRATYSWGLGVLAIVAFGLLSLSGLLLMFYYAPTVERAYASIVALQSETAFGQLTRNLHRWGAHFMVIVTLLHLARVFYTGAYKPPRQFNWVLGMFLLLLTLAASFTGYLLPWDQLGFWAVTIAASAAEYLPGFGTLLRQFIFGGAEVGQAALTRFYALHVLGIPAALAAVIGWHLWRVRKDGGLAVNDENAGEEEARDADDRGAGKSK